MTQEQEEENLFQKVVFLKKERDLLYVLFEELDELIKSGYACTSCADETSRLFYAYNEYKKWKKDENST